MSDPEGASPIHSDRLPALTGLRIFALVFVYFDPRDGPAGAPGFLRPFSNHATAG